MMNPILKKQWNRPIFLYYCFLFSYLFNSTSFFVYLNPFIFLSLSLLFLFD